MEKTVSNTLADNASNVRAAFQFALASTVPLALQTNAGLVCAGTGTLFEVAGHYYVVTASHVCDQDLSALFIPADGNLNDRIVCDSILVSRSKNSDEVDVASIELADLAIHRLLEKGYRFLGLDRVDLRGPADPAYLIGFPEAQYRKAEMGIVRPDALVTPKISTPAGLKRPAVEDLDFFYSYSMHAYRLDGSNEIVSRSPELEGISGTSVWLMLRVEGIWRPENSVYVSGIEVAYDHGRYVRVQSWWAVVRLLSLQAPEIAEAFATKTGVSVDQLTKIATSEG